MELSEFLEYLNRGEMVIGGSEIHQYMHQVSQEALRITAELNNAYHTPDEIHALMSKLTGKLVDESFAMFPPFYTDCGKNITIGKNIFINSLFILQDGLTAYFVLLLNSNTTRLSCKRSHLQPNQ